jgi:hypothetical protein
VADSEDENNTSQERGHRTVPPVGVALGDGVVVRMRLGNKKQITRSFLWPWPLGDGMVMRMLLGNKKQVTHSCGRGPGGCGRSPGECGRALGDGVVVRMLLWDKKHQTGYIHSYEVALGDMLRMRLENKIKKR